MAMSLATFQRTKALKKVEARRRSSSNNVAQEIAKAQRQQQQRLLNARQDQTKDLASSPRPSPRQTPPARLSQRPPVQITRKPPPRAQPLPVPNRQSRPPVQNDRNRKPPQPVINNSRPRIQQGQTPANTIVNGLRRPNPTIVQPQRQVTNTINPYKSTTATNGAAAKKWSQIQRANDVPTWNSYTDNFRKLSLTIEPRSRSYSPRPPINKFKSASAIITASSQLKPVYRRF